jgi:L-alanine-DL-glutamate epimerase-like enolase superfamily enzyme
VATIHLTAAHRRVPLFERLFCDFEAELYGEDGVPKDGCFMVPTGPGLGREPAAQVIEKYRVRS